MVLRFLKKLFGQKGVKQLYVGNLAYKANKGDLYNFFKVFGAIENINMIRDRNTGNFKGFCFIKFTNHQDAKRALKKANGELFKGRKIIVQYARN